MIPGKEEKEFMKQSKKFFAEFLGTFVLVFFACGTAAVLKCNGANPDAAYALTALAFGLVIVAMAYSVGQVSGCHINPAVSLAMLMDGRMDVKSFLGYVVSQCLGAVAGALCLSLVLGGNESGLGTNGLYQNQVLASLVIEIILTFIFVFVILAVTSKEDYSRMAGLVIGLTLTLVHILGIHFTGTSVNPARSLGPALITGGPALANVWVFIVGPLAGGALAACCWKWLGK